MSKHPGNRFRKSSLLFDMSEDDNPDIELRGLKAGRLGRQQNLVFFLLGQEK